MAERAALFRKMVGITCKMLILAQSAQEPGIEKSEEDSKWLHDLAELLAERAELMQEIDATDSPGTEAERDEIRGLVSEIRELNAKMVGILEEKQRELGALLDQIRQGQRALVYLRPPGRGSGIILDRKK